MVKPSPYFIISSWNLTFEIWQTMDLITGATGLKVCASLIPSCGA